MIHDLYKWKPISAPEDIDSLSESTIQSVIELWNQDKKKLIDSGNYDEFWRRLIRHWSIETGIIEKLYDLTEGATRLLVQQGFDASLVAHNDTNVDPHFLIKILEDHRQSIDFAMDIIGGQRPLSKSWIKELHQILTRHQPTTQAVTADGQHIEVELLRGEFKRRPNNPYSHDGVNAHEYCPPEHVDAEMDQLISIYNQLPLDRPEVRSAWLHHAFTQIHPFQDGNGRIARVLASLDFIRAGLFPIMVTRNERTRYLETLRAADDGNLKPLVQFFYAIQSQVFRTAISESHQLLKSHNNIQSVLDAAKSKLQARTQANQEAQKHLQKNLEELSQLTFKTLKSKALNIQSELRSNNINSSAILYDAQTQSYYRQQLLQIADSKGHWADLHLPRYWARLNLRDGGLTELVVIFHFIGNPSPGAAVAIAFLTHRESKEQRLSDNPPIDILSEPLLLLSNEQLQAQTNRLLPWLDEVIVNGLAAWTKFL